MGPVLFFGSLMLSIYTIHLMMKERAGVIKAILTLIEKIIKMVSSMASTFTKRKNLVCERQ